MKRTRLALLTTLGVLTGCPATVDFNAGRQYECDPDATDLVGEPQCAEGWRCVEALGGGRCVDESGGARNPCLRDLDCLIGWTCARDNLCRNASLDGPWACAEDADCGPTWLRCGVTGVCIDPTLEQHLASEPFAPLSSPQRLSPPTDGPPDDFSFHAFLANFAGDNYSLIRRDGRDLSAVRASGLIFEPQQVVSARVTLPSTVATPNAVVVSPFGLGFALFTELGLASLGDGELVTVRPEVAGLEKMALHAGLLTFWNDTAAMAATVSEDGVALLTLGAGGETRVGAPAGVNAPKLLDVAASRDFTGAISLYAVTDQGLYARGVSTVTDWQPVAVGGLVHDACPTVAGTHRPLRIGSVEGSSRVHVIARPSSGEGEDYVVALREQLYSVAGVCTAPRHSREATYEYGPCRACPEGGVAEFVGMPTLGQYLTRCRLADGALRVYEVTASSCQGALRVDPLAAADPIVFSTYRSGQSEATEDGLLFGGPPSFVTVPPSNQRTTALFSALLSTVAGSALRYDGQLSLAGGFGNPENQSEYIHVPDVGFFRATHLGRYRPRPTSRDVAPRFVVELFDRTSPTSIFAPGIHVRDLELGPPEALGTAIAQLETTPDTKLNEKTAFAPPSLVASWPRASGGTTLVVTNFDVVLSAYVPEGTPEQSAELPRIFPRFAPAPQLPIRELELVTPRSGMLVEGYVRNDASVFYLQAESDVIWRHFPVKLPVGELVALFKHDGRPRVAYRDGRVYTIPAALQLGAAFESGTASSFAAICNRTYAATSTGLWRLEPAEDGREGEWVREALFDQVLPNPPPEILEGARLFVGPGELIWSGGRGRVLRFTVPKDCPG